MRRRFAAVIIAAGAALGAAASWLTREALSRAELVAPRATEIVYDRNGAFLTQIAHAGVEGYGYWPLRKSLERLAQATLALEDRRFYSHPGVDLWRSCAPLGRTSQGAAQREGASTIAMQVARMQNPAPRGLISKIMEAATGVALNGATDMTRARALSAARALWRAAATAPRMPRAFISTSRWRIFPGPRRRCSRPFRSRPAA